MANYCRCCGTKIPAKRKWHTLLRCAECRDNIDRELQMGKYTVVQKTLENMVNSEPDLRVEVDELKMSNARLRRDVSSLMVATQMKDEVIRELNEKLDRLKEKYGDLDF